MLLSSCLVFGACFGGNDCCLQQPRGHAFAVESSSAQLEAGGKHRDSQRETRDHTNKDEDKSISIHLNLKVSWTQDFHRRLDLMWPYDLHKVTKWPSDQAKLWSLDFKDSFISFSYCSFTLLLISRLWYSSAKGPACIFKIFERTNSWNFTGAASSSNFLQATARTPSGASVFGSCGRVSSQRTCCFIKSKG